MKGRSPQSLRSQRGVAMLLVLAILTLIGSALFLRQLNAENGTIAAEKKRRNSEVLNRAKQALIGYVATQAAKSTENNPGRLPCPEGVSYVGDASNEGIAWGGVATNCFSIGRLPWRTLGLDKLMDASNEPLWYVVSPNWRLTTSTSLLSINSNSIGDISVDGQNAVALIIAPGVRMNAAAATGCTAKNQVRSVPSPTIDVTNYLECFNSGTLAFTTTESDSAYNDQVIRITAADLMPAIEAAVAPRIEREIAPVLKTVYTSASWGIGSTRPAYPYASAFANPATSAMGGTSGTLGGLMPLVTSETFPGSRILCTAGSPALCDPDFVAWTTPAVSFNNSTLYANCSASTATQINCTVYRTCAAFLGILCLTNLNYTYTVTATVANVGMALRQRSFNTGSMTPLGSFGTPTLTLATTGAGSFSIGGSAAATLGGGLSGLTGGLLCGLGSALLGLNICKTEGTLSIPITSVLVDHPLLDARSSASTSWFLRNKWHEVTYYAIAPGYSFASLASTSCVDTPLASVTCLKVANSQTAFTNKVRALLVLAGRSVNGSARPSASATDYLEFGNATAAYEQRVINASSSAAAAQRFNDRVIVVDSN